MAFQLFIDDVDSIKEKVLAYRFVTIEQLQKLCEEFAEADEFCRAHSVTISRLQVEALVQLLDLDGNGQLDQDEVVGVLAERQMLGQGRENELKEAIGFGAKKALAWLRETLKV